MWLLINTSVDCTIVLRPSISIVFRQFFFIFPFSCRELNSKFNRRMCRRERIKFESYVTSRLSRGQLSWGDETGCVIADVRKQTVSVERTCVRQLTGSMIVRVNRTASETANSLVGPLSIKTWVLRDGAVKMIREKEWFGESWSKVKSNETR